MKKTVSCLRYRCECFRELESRNCLCTAERVKNFQSIDAYERENNCFSLEKPKYRRMAFLFWKLFPFQDFYVFVLCKLEKWWYHEVCNKILHIVLTSLEMKECSSNLALKNNVHHKKLNDTHSVTAMETLLAPVSFCQKLSFSTLWSRWSLIKTNAGNFSFN